MKTLLFMFCSSVACAQVSLPDENLRNLLLNSNATNQLVALNETGHYFAIDANSNGSIEQTEALAVYELRMEDADIQSLQGIGNFSNIRKINAMFNQIGTADFTGLTHLEELKLGSNAITSINLTGLANLKVLDLFFNQLETLDLSTLVNLEVLDTFENTGLEEINFGGIDKIRALLIGNNPVATLDVSNFSQLQQFECFGTNITGMDVSHNPLITTLIVAENPHLQTLNVKNNTTTVFDLMNNPELVSVCADAGRVAEFEAYFLDLGQEVNVTSECAMGNEELSITGASLYPNPTTGKFTIQCSELLSIEIYTIDGRLVEKTAVNGNSATVDISGKPAGLYLVKAYTAKGVYNGRLLKE